MLVRYTTDYNFDCSSFWSKKSFECFLRFFELAICHYRSITNSEVPMIRRTSTRELGLPPENNISLPHTWMSAAGHSRDYRPGQMWGPYHKQRVRSLCTAPPQLASMTQCDPSPRLDLLFPSLSCIIYVTFAFSLPFR